MKDVDSFVSSFYVSTWNHLCREQILLLWQNVLDSWALIVKAMGKLGISQESSFGNCRRAHSFCCSKKSFSQSLSLAMIKNMDSNKYW